MSTDIMEKWQIIRTLRSPEDLFLAIINVKYANVINFLFLLKHNLLQCSVWIEVPCSMHKTNEDQHHNWNLKNSLTVMTRASCKCNISYTHLKRLGLSGAQRFIWHERRPQWISHITKLGQMCLSKVRLINKGKQTGILPEGQSPGQGIRKIDWDMSSH
jgi:hypothetical protein